VDPTKTIPDMLEHVQQLKMHKIHELNQIANKQDHQVICLPPCHCHYNPTELIWMQVKREVAGRNKA
jgi:hypothetical protein